MRKLATIVAVFCIFGLFSCKNWVSGIPSEENGDSESVSVCVSSAESTLSIADSSLEESVSTEDSLVEESESKEEDFDEDSRAVEVYEGLFYALSEDGEYYIVIGGEREVVDIPAECAGKPIREIGAGAFVGAYITEVNLSGNITKIGANAFRGCISLRRVRIAEGVSEIAAAAFLGCSGIGELVLPKSLQRIGEGAFYGCSSLESVTFLETTGWTLSGRTIPEGWLQDKSTAAECLVVGREFAETNSSMVTWERE